MNNYEEFNIDIVDEGEEYVQKCDRELENAFKNHSDLNPAELETNSAKKLYSLIRKLRPRKIVETGVCNGYSSSIILKALKDNDKGKLYSIDLPALANETERTAAVVAPNKKPGWLIPQKFKDRWEFYKGNTFYQTPKALKKAQKIDIFLHDSLHTYEAMMFEFSIAWKHLKQNGILLADNVNFNNAFKDLANEKQKTKYQIGEIALIKK